MAFSPISASRFGPSAGSRVKSIAAFGDFSAIEAALLLIAAAVLRRCCRAHEAAGAEPGGP